MVSPAPGDFLASSEEVDTTVLWTVVHKIQKFNIDIQSGIAKSYILSRKGVIRIDAKSPCAEFVVFSTSSQLIALIFRLFRVDFTTVSIYVKLIIKFTSKLHIVKIFTTLVVVLWL
jgi:hypothetical protein